ncbi:hypothetical protein Trydic_g6257 [Trypoxylus dichotomus]
MRGTTTIAVLSFHTNPVNIWAFGGLQQKKGALARCTDESTVEAVGISIDITGLSFYVKMAIGLSSLPYAYICHKKIFRKGCQGATINILTPNQTISKVIGTYTFGSDLVCVSVQLWRENHIMLW